MLQINKKEDLLIPFDTLGDAGWETKTKLIIDALAENWNQKATAPIPVEEIDKLEARLGTSLPAGLKLFYQTFGIADVGEQLQSFKEIGWIKGIWAEQPEYGPEFTATEQEHLPFLVSFIDYLGNGNIFCFHSETKEIFYYDHDDRPYLTKMFSTVDTYLKGCLIFAQADLSSEAEAEEWTEEVVSGIVGIATVKKWRY